MKKRIYLHVGLPKTATTWLQKTVFPNLNLKLVLWQEEQYQPVIKSLQAFYRGNSFDSKSISKKLLALLNDDPKVNTLLISNENISVKIIDFWNLEAVNYIDLIDRSNILRNELALHDVHLSIIFVSREQPEWLASRYAESAKRHEHFSQSHFEELVKTEEFKACVRDSILFFSGIEKHITAHKIHNWFHFLRYEDFKSDPSAFLNKFTDILGTPLTYEESLRLLGRTSERLNDLKVDTNRWSLKDKKGKPSDKQIVLNDSLKLYISKLFEESSLPNPHQENKRVILVLSVGQRPWLASVRRTWESYAKKCSADLIIEKELPYFNEFELPSLPDKPGRPHKRAYAAKAYLPWKYLTSGYDQVLMLDDTCCISKDADSIFDIAPDDSVVLTPTGVDHAVDSFSFIVEESKKSGLPKLKNFNSADYGNTGVVLYNKCAIEALEPDRIIKASRLLFNRRPHQTLFYYLMNRGNVPIKMISGSFNKVPGTEIGMELSERKKLKEIGDMFDTDIQIYHVTGLTDNRRDLIEDIVKRQGF